MRGKRNRNPAIVAGDPHTVLQLGPAGLRPDGAWTQQDSDTLCHFFQVHGQIARSSWLEQECRISDSGGRPAGRFPELESFVYAAVYFRQLFSGKDRLFSDACERYVRVVDSRSKAAWIHREKESALANWRSPGLFITSYSTEAVFDAMLYGTHLLHSLPRTWKEHREAFRDILANTPRERMLFELHASLREMLNHVSNVSIVMFQDFSRWLSCGIVPAPDVMWHESVFAAGGEIRGARQSAR